MGWMIALMLAVVVVIQNYAAIVAAVKKLTSSVQAK